MSAADILSFAILVFGGVGLFLLRMSFMIDGLKALAGEPEKTVLPEAAEPG